MKLWSSSEYDNNNAWVFCTDTGASQGGVDWNNKDNNNNNNVVRPVLAFLMKDFFVGICAITVGRENDFLLKKGCRQPG